MHLQKQAVHAKQCLYSQEYGRKDIIGGMFNKL